MENMVDKHSMRLECAIADIRDMIASGKYGTGDRLPSERQIGKMFNISRNTARMALRHFSSMGIIEIRPGSGNYLVEQKNVIKQVFDTKQLTEKSDIWEIIEARRYLESGTVELAARRASLDDKIRLRQCYARLEFWQNLSDEGIDLEKSRREFIRTDYEFHLMISEISCNSILRELLEAIREMMEKICLAMSEGSKLQEHANQFHKRMLNAICDNDSSAAVQAINEHLDDMASVLKNLQ